MTSEVRFNTAGLTHEGRVRTLNEDSHLEREEIGLWVVADGMGGHQDGQVASAAIVQALTAITLQGDFADHLRQLNAVLSAANQAIFSAAEAVSTRMGSTVVILHIDAMSYACIWVGDSRIYRLRDGVLTRLTRDHTEVQGLIDRGILAAEDAQAHPMSHVLSRAVGVEAELRAEMTSGDLDGRDVFLLCSDGLTGLVSDEEIAAHLAAGSRAASRDLLELALARGAPDNVTVVTVSCEEKTALILEQES